MPRQSVFEVSGHIQGETERAVRFSDDGQTWHWLPLSQIEIERHEKGSVTITAPEWLLKEKGLL